MNTLYCDLFGKRVENRMLRIILRLLFLVILLVIHYLFGMDVTIIVGLAILAADLDSIAEIIEKRNKDC